MGMDEGANSDNGAKRVLIVDDDCDFVESTVAILKPSGYELATAQAPEEAIEVIASFEPQAMLLDIRLGQRDGTELLSEVHSLRPQIVPIVVTAYADLENAISALHKGAYAYLRKPVAPEELLATLQRCFEKINLQRKRTEAENKLRQERDFIRTLIESSPMFFVAISPDGKTLMMNQAMLDALGYTKQEVEGKDYLSNFVPESERRKLKDVFRTLVESHQPARSRSRVLTKDGRELLVEWRGNPVFREDGQFDFFFGVGEDITERQRAADALQESEERYRLLAENISDVIWVIDLKTMELVYVSPSVERVLGFKPNEAISLGLKNVLTSASLQLAGEVLKEEQKHERSGTKDPHRHRTVKLELRRKDGRTVWTEITMSAVRDASKKPVQILGVARDITERKRAQEALRAERDRLKSLMDGLSGAGIGIDVVGTDYRVLLQNEALKQRFGDLTGKLCYEGYTGLDKPCEGCPMKVATKTRRVESMELTGRDGRLYQVFSAPLTNPDGSVDKAIEVVVDITGHKLAQERLRQVEKMEAVGRLAGGIAHDFNNILTAVIGNLDLAKMDLPPDHPVLAQIIEARNAANRASTLTQQLLAFSRRQMIAPRVVNLNEIIRDLTRMLRRLIREDIQISTSLERKLPSIKADPTQIEQIIMNLAVNARDAMPYGGKLTIATKSIEVAEDSYQAGAKIERGSYVVLSISDTGQGMDEETISHIFEPFYTTKEMGRGTGLGLSTVYGIVKQSGGYIFVDSQPGRGTTFDIYLPAVGEVAAPTKKVVMPRGPAVGHGESVLVVEDEQSIRDLLERVLTNAGYKVLIASTCSEALGICEDPDEPVDLLLTDLIMPDMRGTELALLVKSRWPQIRMLLMSGYTDSETGELEEVGEEIEFISKPFSPAALLEKIREVLTR